MTEKSWTRGMNSFEMNYQSISFSLDLCMIIVIIRNISRNWKIVEKKKKSDFMICSLAKYRGNVTI